ncbi:arylsulfatase [Flavobacterium ginsenosidimutans]|uniref:arylsulfatase n=1 Tax=Flavobacterium ginsenosidimutans TaxID=687844 RepID=UPI000DAD8F18|nr:arylsulfatase [Flavobacterium ginsenosidimutans]KAF2330392.1 arylsulfatase [Flavobacterium ginsenosidimutans]
MKISKSLFLKSIFTFLFCLSLGLTSKIFAQADPQQVTKETFKGKMALDIRDSKSDWSPYLPKKAPAGAPNILFILYDDTGMAAWSPYGGAINMPTMQKLADNGITYSQWHTTALCSPTRSTLLTGRNHHLNGMAAITETADGYPGASGRIPKQAATIGQILQDNGWSTFWIGKDHNVPEQDIAAGGPRSTWPLQMGFDRFYGFLGGETNQWYPDLTEDNHFIEPPATPEEGYHLSKDLADHALEYLKDQQATNPSKPWYMWYCPGANHAPHQAPEEYIAKYKGKFDDGYDAYRKWVLPRMIAKGVIPPGTKMDNFNPMPPGVANPADNVLDWNKLKPEEKKLFSRLAEVYAGFSEYTDAQVGRIIDYLEKTGQLENTLVIYAADNGASGEGSESGSVNENKFFNGYPDELKENLKYIDKLGSPDTYEHYPTGWAAAFSTPFKMFKRYSQYAGGTCDPLVMSWPKGIKAKGVVRDQFHHSTDIVPTILDVCGLEMPKEYRGVAQYPLSGVSMRYTFDAAPNTKTQKHIQYFAMLGSRALWKDGWKAVALHAPLGGKGHFDKDEWELYNTDIDRSESNNLAKKYPDKLKELIKDWDDEAAKNLVLPLDDRSAIEVLGTERPTSEPPRDLYKYYPGTSAVPEGVAVNVRGRSYKILADVDVKDAKASGVLFAHGSRFGGHTLFIKDGKLNYVYNFLGIAPEQKFTSNVPITTGKHVFGMEFIREKAGPNGESLGQMKLYIDGKEVASGPMRTQSGKFTLAGDGLCVGFDSGDSVSKEYKTPGTYKGGEIIGVGVSVGKIEYTDLNNEAKRALGRD